MHNNKKIKKNLIKDLEKLKSKDGYLNAGFPRFHTLFGRDSLISSWQTLDFDPTIARNTLKILAKYQAKRKNLKKEAEFGEILHEHRFTPDDQKKIPAWGWPYYGSVDSTSLFLIVLHKYIQKTNDKRFLNQLWDNAKKALQWHFNTSLVNKYGFITYERTNPQGLFHQGWKDSVVNHLKITPPVAIVGEQGYAYSAYLSFVKLADILNKDKQLRTKALAAASRLKKEFLKHFWWEEEKYFALGLDNKNKQRRAVTSNVGHLLICDDILNKKQAELVRDRLFKKDLWTAGGIRTLSDQDPDFNHFSYHLGSVWPHDNWFIYTGLKNHGFDKDALKIKQALTKAYLQLGHMPELFAVKNKQIMSIEYIETMERQNRKHKFPNPLQAWSSGALLDMLDK